MILTTDQTERLRIAAQPLMDFLNTPEFHPHIQVVVTSTDAEIKENPYIQDKIKPLFDEAALNAQIAASKSNAERLSGLGGAFIGGVQQMSIHDKWNAEIMRLRNLAKDIRLTGLASRYAERAYLELEKISQEGVAKSICNELLREGFELTQKAIESAEMIKKISVEECGDCQTKRTLTEHNDIVALSQSVLNLANAISAHDNSLYGMSWSKSIEETK